MRSLIWEIQILRTKKGRDTMVSIDNVTINKINIHTFATCLHLFQISLSSGDNKKPNLLRIFADMATKNLKEGLQSYEPFLMFSLRLRFQNTMKTPSPSSSQAVSPSSQPDINKERKIMFMNE